jgi:hypothetical protein
VGSNPGFTEKPYETMDHLMAEKVKKNKGSQMGQATPKNE